MEYVISVLLSGISVGGQYALIAIGYTLVYGILRLINFAHGDVFMVAGLMGIYFSAALPITLSIPLVILVTVALGFTIERVAYKPLRNAPRMSVMISAIGVSYLLQNLATYVTGGQPMTYPSIPFLSDTINVFGTQTKWVVILTPILVLVLVFLLTQLIDRTKIGMAMRAVSKDFETSRLMGIKINSVISMTFIIGSALAAVGSVLVLHQLSRDHAHGRRHAGPQGLRRGGIRRNRIHPRCGDRSFPDRHLRDHYQGTPFFMGRVRIFRCLHFCPADRHPDRKASGSFRGSCHRQGLMTCV